MTRVVAKGSPTKSSRLGGPVQVDLGRREGLRDPRPVLPAGLRSRMTALTLGTRPSLPDRAGEQREVDRLALEYSAGWLQLDHDPVHSASEKTNGSLER